MHGFEVHYECKYTQETLKDNSGNYSDPTINVDVFQLAPSFPSCLSPSKTKSTKLLK